MKHIFSSLSFFAVLLVALLFTSCQRDKKINRTISKQTMVEILDSLYQHQKFPDCFVRNDLGVQYFENKIAQAEKNNDSYTTAQLKFGLVNQWLADNKIDSAIVLAKQLLNELSGFKNLSKEKWGEANDQILNTLCIACLRKGELQNCGNNHNANSCILPFQASAFHRDESGSDSAIAYMIQHLTNHPDDARLTWLLNIAAYTVNKYPSAVPEKFRLNFEKYSAGNEFLRFKDVAMEKNVNHFGHFGGVDVEDFNNDGLPDIFTTSTPLNENVQLYLQTADSGFIDYTNQAGLGGVTGGGNTAHADFNNDGLMDIFVMRGGWLGAGGFQPNSLLKNLGKGKFEDITIKAGLYSNKITHTACWADFNNDGWLDLFVGNENQSFDESNPGPFDNSKSELFLNNHDGTFKNVAEECGIKINAWVKGSTWLDYNNDGKQDLYVSVYGGKNLLYKNEGADVSEKIHFAEVAEQAGVQLPLFSFPVAAFDINQDGWDDLFVNGFNIEKTALAFEYMGKIEPVSPIMIFINQRNGTFKEVAKEMGLYRSVYAMAINYGDLDLDGFPDLYMGTGFGDLAALYPNILLQNSGGTKFLDVTSASGTGHLQKGHGIAISDIDRDGDNDIYAELGGFVSGDAFWNAYFENPGNENEWLSLKLEGSKANRCAIGAKIKVVVQTGTGKRNIYSRIGTGGSYGCSQLQQLIGLGKAISIDTVEVIWSGETTPEIYGVIKPHKAYLLKQNNPSVVELEYTPVKNRAVVKQEHHH